MPNRYVDSACGVLLSVGRTPMRADSSTGGGKGGKGSHKRAMKFIELTGRQLRLLLTEDELRPNDLAAAGVKDETIVRVNQQGDIEVRRPDGWDVIGGLLGDFEQRIVHTSGLRWA